MVLIFKLDLNMVKMSRDTTNEVSMSSHSRAIDGWTNTLKELKHYLPTYVGGKVQSNLETVRIIFDFSVNLIISWMGTNIWEIYHFSFLK